MDITQKENLLLQQGGDIQLINGTLQYQPPQPPQPALPPAIVVTADDLNTMIVSEKKTASDAQAQVDYFADKIKENQDIITVSTGNVTIIEGYLGRLK